jgi:hypothetical protein
MPRARRKPDAVEPKAGNRKRGRPPEFEQQTADRICELIAEGGSIRRICAMDGMPAWSTVRRWLGAHDEFRTQYARAREDQADNFADEIIELSRRVTDPDPQKGLDPLTPDAARVAIDARKWKAAKLRPRVYGERITNEIEPSDTFTTMMRAFLGEIDGASHRLPEDREETR